MTKKMEYTYNDVYKETLSYFNGDDLATSVWISKYCLKTVLENGDVIYHEKTPDDMFWRIAKELERTGMKYENPLFAQEIYELLKDFKYVIPQGRPMAGIGNEEDVTSISNCFVVGNEEDSYGSIARVDQEIMQLSKRGGGVGTDLSSYRPANSKVKNAAKTTTGPVEICANRFSNTIREVGQNGRRGALMLSMDILHPDAEKFIDSKMEEGKITGANISLRIKDSWLKSFIDNENPDEKNKKLWKKLVYNAWKSAEPGILFWDTIINESVSDCYSDLGFKTTSTNPCGEIPLSPYDSCRLMLLNLYSYVDKPFTSEAKFDFDKFSVHSRLIMKLMDNMIDLEIEKIDKILEKVKSDPESDETKALEISLWKKVRYMAEKGRRSGIGITAEGDMLAALGLKYGTKEATKFAEEVQRVMSTNVYIESCNLSQSEGREVFEVFDWEREKDNPFINRLISYGDKLSNELKELIKGGRRNISLLTCAPAGSVSCLTQTTSGIEPLFLPRYMRKRKIDKNAGKKADFIDETGDWFEYFYVYHPKFITYYSIKMGISESESKKILTTMPEQEFNDIYKESPYFGATSNDTDWVEKVIMQGSVQKWIDHSISCTVNVPKETPVEVVESIYETAWKYKCKGVTIYRDGSRNGVLTETKTESKSQGESKTTCIDNVVTKRPKSISAKVLRFNNGGERWVSVIGLINNKPYEIFTGLCDKLNIPQNVEEGFIIKNKEEKIVKSDLGEEEKKLVSRYDFQYKDKDGQVLTVIGLSRTFKEEYWNYTKLISGLLRHNMPIEYVIKVITSLNLENTTINSWKNGVIRTLKKFVKDGDTNEKCPQCGGKLIRQNACNQCVDCGWSKCS